MQDIRTIDHLMIPLADGTRLAARLWLPVDAETRPVPAILEYIPYRKQDGTRPRDEPMHGWFAAQGYAAIRVDMRGSGESDGHLADEYLPQELSDGCEVIDWLSRQPWCSGSVGMMGKSWGGFNALQVAALRPAALKAIITVCSTDDRYADDVHYMGGCLLNDNLWWGSIMLAYQARPLDPALVGEEWRKAWAERIETLPFFPALWLEHQRRDAYWKHGSICEDFGAIDVPVFAVGGWADAYTNAIPRLLEGLDVPRLGLIGPWAHVYPHDGTPGPAIGFLQEAKRWWDTWLKGKDSGIMSEPMLRAFIEEWSPPGHRDPVPGRFVGETHWPPTDRVPFRCFLDRGRLVADPVSMEPVSFSSPAYVGLGCGEWMGTGVRGEEPADQRLDDGMSLAFDSEPLAERLEILGAPEIEIEVAADKPVAQLCARLCDVAPDGASRRVSYGVLNLTHRESHATPSALEPGRFYKVRVKLNDCGYAFRAGHRIRVALSSAYWPLVWPSPERATLTLAGVGTLALPHRPAPQGEALPSFEPPARGPSTPTELVSRGRMERSVVLDLLGDEAVYVTDGRGGLFGEGALRLEETGTELSHALRRELSISGKDPLSAAFTIRQSYDLGREGWRTRVETLTSMRSTKTHFIVEGSVRAFENGGLVASRDFPVTAIERDLV
jgi:uncharacterized protein